MKDDLLNKVRTFRTANDLIYLLNPNEKHSATVKVCLPSNEDEATLYAIWKNLLGHHNFGVKDDFFQVGGNSLKAVQLISRISRDFAVQIQLTEVFIQPTIEQLALHISTQRKGGLSVSIVSSQPRPERIPLSFSQERLWFIDRLEGSVQYHIPEVFKLGGHLDIHALEYAFQQIIKRHEVLRTVIRGEEGKEYQYIKEENGWQLGIIDGSVYKENTNELQLCITNLINSPFDLSKDDMVRANLIILGEQETILVITMHHIASDGWSIAILVKELTKFYSSYTKKITSGITPLTLQYADYAIWQRQHLQGELFDKKLQYWKRKLQGVTSLQLPTDFPRQAEQSINGASIHFKIDQDLVKQLQELSKQVATTLFMTTLAAFKVLLYRYTTQEDICVGTAIANRTRHEIEDLIGFFVNTLALRSEVNGETSFTELLQEVKKTTIEAYENQEVPFEKVVEAIVKERDLSRNPLFQVMFVWQNTPEVSDLRLGEITLTREAISYDTSKFDLTFSLTQTDDGLEVVVEYNTDLYSKHTIERMIRHFLKLLYAIVKEPHQIVALLPILTDEEEQQLIQEFNKPEIEYFKDKTVINLFEEQVTSNPEREAVIWKDGQLTYKELNNRSNQLAHYLQCKGVKAESLVPICMERSVEMIIGILGILKAGGAYVPIDPEYPEERIAYMLQDSKANTIVSMKESRPHVKLLAELNIIELDTDWPLISEQPIENPNTNLDVFNLAYIIYTSGSTGTPKGVMIEHHSLIDKLLTESDLLHVDECTKTCLTTNYIFDASLLEIFLPIIVGGTMTIPTKNVIFSSENLVHFLQQQGVTILQGTPGFIQHMLTGLKEGDNQNLAKNLKQLCIGGESLPASLVREIKKIIPHAEINNHYGPTESTIDAIVLEDVEEMSKNIIGKPIVNAQIYILDRYYKPVPIGVMGEIFIGGGVLARGYLNSPELTLKKFISNPFKSSERVYKTGDQGKWLEDGNIEFIGRKDDQIKIMGNRIELGEIETILNQHNYVDQAVVKVSGTDNKILQAFIVLKVSKLNSKDIISKNNDDEIVQDIREYLNKRVPSYMIPNNFYVLKKFPFMPNGKVDKNALTYLNESAIGSGKEYIAPVSNLEITLAGIWKELLDLEQVGIKDNFFELGGHSLLAMRVISSIRKELQVELAIKALFAHPTIAELAIYIKDQQAPIFFTDIKAQTRPEHVPLSFSQERLWFIDQLEGSVQYHMPLVLRCVGHLNKAAINFALQSIVNRHEVLRTIIRKTHGETWQYIKEKNQWQLDISDGSPYKEDTKGLYQFIDFLIDQPFDLSADYMIRATLITQTEREHLLVITMHHLASDGWSIPIIIRELTELYISFVEERPSLLAPLDIQYADYAIWQRKRLQGEMLDKKLSYWKKKLEGVVSLQLPTDYPRSAVQSTQGATITFDIDEKINEGLLQLSSQQGTTLFMTLLAAFKVLLYHYSDQEDICVGTSIADRQHKEVENLIGFFINTLPLRTQLNNDSSFIDLLQQIKATTLDAYENQEVPFEKIVEVVIKERDMSRHPLFQVMLVLQNSITSPEVSLGEIQLIQEEVGLKRTKFDLSLLMAETPMGLKGEIEYSTDLYKAETIERMVGHFKVLLSSIVKEPNQKVGKLPLLTPPEEIQIMEEFNNTVFEYPKDKTVVHFFEEHAAKTPDNIAVVFDKQKLTYGMLNQRANQLAHYLRDRGVKEETLVPVYMERSIEMIIGILGILKAGAAYVPMDTEYPVERIIFMLQDTKAGVMMTNGRDKTKLQTQEFIEVIDLGKNEPIFNKEPGSNLLIKPMPDNLAYMIYTSGSTGTPKGVMIEHKGLTNLITWHNREYEVTELSRTTAMAGVGFDAFGWEVWPYLSAGASVNIINDETRLDSSKLLELFNSIRISHTFISTALVQDFVIASKDKKTSLKYLLTGGDKLMSLDQGNIAYRIVNNYGPTEYTVVTTNYHLLQQDKETIPPIGKPIANTVIRILNEHERPVPIGVYGELYIGGAGLTRGYFNQPELTAEKFVTDPFRRKSRSRMYKTGDLGRWLSNGNIQYLGRKDEQVKLRGNRIEIGEIESVLLQSGFVNQAVVIMRDSFSNGKQLLAYIVTSGSFDKHKIVSYLQTKLPRFMIPAVWVELESLPLTTNGKINKKALPEPAESDLVYNEYVAPRNEVEETLADIWKELLQLERVGIYDNFFEMGGHSLLAKRMASSIERRLLVSVPIHVLFQFTTINDLGKYMTLQLNIFPKKKDTKEYKVLNI